MILADLQTIFNVWNNVVYLVSMSYNKVCFLMNNSVFNWQLINTKTFSGVWPSLVLLLSQHGFIRKGLAQFFPANWWFVISMVCVTLGNLTNSLIRGFSRRETAEKKYWGPLPLTTILLRTTRWKFQKEMNRKWEITLGQDPKKKAYGQNLSDVQ